MIDKFKMDEESQLIETFKLKKELEAKQQLETQLVKKPEFHLYKDEKEDMGPATTR